VHGQTDATNYVPVPFEQRTISGATDACTDAVIVTVVDAAGTTSSASGNNSASVTVPADAVYPITATLATLSNGNVTTVLSDVQGVSYATAPNGASCALNIWKKLTVL
jgi:hypothetical protein